MKTKNFYRFLNLLIVVLLAINANAVVHAALPPAPLLASPLTFNPSADAYVNAASPGSNFGKNISLRVDGSPIMRSYLRFIVSGVGGTTVSSAILRIYANSANTTGIAVHSVADNTWTETGITYANSPVLGSVIKNSLPFSGGTWVSVDITNYIIADGTFNLAIDSTNTTNTNLASRESTNAPQLVVTLTGSGGATSTPTSTLAATATRTPTTQATATNTSVKTATNTPIVTATNTPIKTATNTPVATATNTPVKTSTNTPVATATNTPVKTATNTPVITATNTPIPTATGTVSSTCSPVLLTKGPTLIYTGDNTKMRVFWQWSSNATFSMEWGTSTSYSQGNSAVNPNNTTTHLYQYDISGLTPGTQYYYQVVVGTQCSGGSFFAAPASNATGVKFTAYGDTRTNGSIHNGIAGQVDALFASDPAFQSLNLNVGDWVSADSESAWTSEWFVSSYTNLRKQDANLADIGIRGNHEGAATLWKQYWPEPFQGGGLYWSFDYGPMHVDMLDAYTAYTVGSAQYNWLKADLAATTKTWKIAMIHEPGWSANGGHPNNTTVQTALQPLFVQYGVAMLLSGHNHYYARAIVSGVVHLTVGGGGAPLYTPATGQPNIVTVTKAYSFGEFSISGNTLTAKIVNNSGVTIDTFTITK